MEKIKIAIIGSGPAGYTAAIYAARAGLNPVLFTGNQIGGQLIFTSDVENYPGFPNGILGPEMMSIFQKQAERFGTQIRYSHITKVNFFKKDASSYHTLTIDNQIDIETEAIIIATGASAKWLGIPQETKLQGKGVSSCAVCDGFFFKKQDIAVIGGGDTACEEATYLSHICSKVFLIVRKNKLKASLFMQKQVESIQNIHILYNQETLDILGETSVTGILLKNNTNNETTSIQLSAVFVAIGHYPNTDIFKDQLELDTDGYIITKPGTSKTNIPGVFAVGDVQDRIYKQAVTAAGSGCMGALDAEKFLSHKNKL
ncbi:MAG: thioredoxin-disulfide reductase [Chitinophagaceae bacterium]|nr:thioredoxin-disulfide reductase [Chitinophagaceae bacterium]